MKSNFFSGFHNVNRVTLSDIGMFSLMYGSISIILLVARFLFDLIFNGLNSTFMNMLWFALIATGILSISFVIFSFVYNYFVDKNNEYSSFYTKDLKKWYALTPEKFIFDNYCNIVYYIHGDSNCDTDKFRAETIDSELDITTMYPKNLFESLKLRFFVNNLYTRVKMYDRYVERKAEELQKQKDIIHANNEMMRVMNSIQKDIDKVLAESNKTVKEETEKMKKIAQTM